MKNKDNQIQIKSNFESIATRSVDGRLRICLGDVLKGLKRVEIFLNEEGDILLRPLVEIPANEVWLYKNQSALKLVSQGLRDAKKGKVTRLRKSDVV